MVIKMPCRTILWIQILQNWIFIFNYSYRALSEAEGSFVAIFVQIWVEFENKETSQIDEKIITFNWKKQVFERNSIFVKLKCLGYKSINLLARIRNVDTKISSFFDKKWKPLFTPTTSDHWNIKKFFSIFFLWSVCHIIQNSFLR